MWHNSLNVLAAVVCLVACTTNKEHLLPAGNTSMMDVWSAQTSEGGGSLAGRKLLDARLHLRRPVADGKEASTGETAFPRLPNPDLVMFVFPHMAGGVPIPGYSTVFPMFGRVEYAMPGETIK
ncbi:MAG: TIGR03751 family conjugal transfer lipoprotein [Betaproteobacteria bacterium]|nr:TIGR03751 family conjugal transfer lipoprotein [Betaproteobacteria bacterium]